MNTITEFRRWLSAEIRLLDDPNPDENQYYEAAQTVKTAKRHAQSLGLLDVVRVCSQVKTQAFALPAAQAVLRDCLRLMKTAPVLLTPPQVAKQYGVSPDAVRGWIVSGKLAALNIGKKIRPRYRITQEALVAFNAKQMPNVLLPTPRSHRKAAPDLLVTRYSKPR